MAIEGHILIINYSPSRFPGTRSRFDKTKSGHVPVEEGGQAFLIVVIEFKTGPMERHSHILIAE